MTQKDFGTIDPVETNGTELATLLGEFRDALNTCHRGGSRPAYAQGGMFWINDTTADWVLNFFDGNDDISIGKIDTAGNTFRPNLTTWEPEVTIASAATTNVLGAATSRVNISGTTNITSLGSRADTIKFIRFQGAGLTLTHNSNIILPGQQSITTRAGDRAIIMSDSAGVAFVISYQRADGSPVFGDIATLASAATTDLGSRQQQSINITGNTAITSFGTTAPTGAIKYLKFDNAVTLTASANIIVPGGQSLVAAANDVVTVRHEGAGVWRVMATQAGGTLAGGGQNTLTTGNSLLAAPATIIGSDFINTTSANLSLSTKFLAPTQPLIAAIGNGIDLTGIKNKVIQKTADFTWDNLVPNARNFLYLDDTGTPGSTVNPPERVRDKQVPSRFTGSLLHFEASLADEYGASAMTLETYGAAPPAITGSVAKFGNYSLEFTKTSRGYLTVTTPQRLNSYDEWTIEFEVRRKSVGVDNQLLHMSPSAASAYGLSMGFNPSNQLQVYASTGEGSWNLFAPLVSTITVADTTTFHHIAICYSATTGYKFFIDGVLAMSSAATAKTYSLWNKIHFGQNTGSTAQYALDGYMDELRITPGVAKYSANFTRPTAPWTPDQRDVFYEYLNLMKQFPSGAPSNRVYVGEAVTGATGVLDATSYRLHDWGFETIPLNLPLGAKTVVAHNLGRKPRRFEGWWVCIDADLGYSPGEEVVAYLFGMTISGQGHFGIAIQVFEDRVELGVAGNPLQTYNKAANNGTMAVITPSKWRFVLRMSA